MEKKPKLTLEDLRVKEQWRKYQHIGEPLHWAAAIGDHIATKEMVCGLEGAKMVPRSEVDHVGRTPLMRAALWGRPMCGEHLVQDFVQRPRPEPPQFNTADPVGWTAFINAAAGLQSGPTTVGILRSLLKKQGNGLDVHCKDIAGRTALHVASQMHNSYAVAFLVRHCKLEVAATDLAGRTPLHFAVGQYATSLHRRIVAPKEKLVDLQRHTIPPIKFMMPSKDSKTILDVEKDYLRMRRKTEGINPLDPEAQMKTVKLLLKYNADPSVKDHEGQTPLDLCSDKDEALRALLEEHMPDPEQE